MKVGARQCEVVEISSEEAASFLNNYHRQKSVQAIYNIALKYQNDIIALMTFGYPRYNPKYQWELLRLCFHPSYTISGGSEKLFKYFLENYDPHSIISYCDYNYFTGEVYDRLGFSKLRVSTGSKIWYKGDRFITDNLLRQFGADKLIGTHDGKGTNNEEIMLREGWQFKIDKKGQGTYIWNGKGKFGYIYLVTDTLHNKQYVGQHRGYKLDEKYFGSGQIIRSIIKKYGTDILKIEILDWADSQEDLSEKEIKYINEYNTLYPNGYNLTLRKQAIEPYTVKNVEETKQKLKQITTKLWQNEEYKQKQHSGLIKALSSDDYKQERAKIAFDLWKDDEYRKKQEEATKNKISNVDYIEHLRNTSKALWQNEEYRSNVIEAIKKSTQTDEFRSKRSLQQKKLATNENYLKKLSEGVKRYYAQNPSTRDKVSEASKRHWKDENYREKIKKANKAKWQDPEYREKMSAIRSNRWKDEDYRKKMANARATFINSESYRKKLSTAAKGKKWWNNGTITKLSREKPEGDEWKEGRLLKKSK